MSKRYDGVNVDVEGLDPQNRDSFTELIIELKSLVDEVYLATPAVDWSNAYDYTRKTFRRSVHYGLWLSLERWGSVPRRHIMLDVILGQTMP